MTVIKKISALFILFAFSQQAASQNIEVLFDGQSTYLFNINATPDGTLMVFDAKLDGQSENDIYLLNSKTGAITNLTNHPSDDASPDISNDGRYVVFRSDRTGTLQLWLLDIETGTETQLTAGDAGNSSPNFSPDGNRIAYISKENGSWDVWVMDIDTGKTSPLTNSPGGEYRPAWSPTEDLIVFMTSWTDWVDIWTVSFPDGKLTPLSVSEREDYYPTWSTDGNWVVYQGDGGNTKNHNDIWAVSKDGGEQFRLSDFPGAKAWLHQVLDSKDFIFTIANLRSYISTLSLADGAKPVQLTSGEVLDSHPVFSPDGSTIVFDSLRSEGATLHLFSIPDEGGDIRQLTFGRAFDVNPTFNQKGNSIFFIRGRGADKDDDIWSLDMASGELKRLTLNGGLFRTALCPAKDILLVAGRKEELEPLFLAKVLTTGGEIKKITHLNEDIAFGGPYIFTNNPLDCSADGRFLLYSSMVDGREVVFQTELDGGTSEPITDPNFNSSGAKWSPDGSKIIFSSDRLGNFDLFLKDVATGTVTRLTDDPRDEKFPNWAPDGNSIVFQVEESIFRIVKMKLDLPQ